jgi:class 3 adenylate cyclase
MESASIKRRLTAILAADAVNYSRHMGEDEEGTLRQLAAHRAVIDRIIEAHEGRIVGTAGDSVLAEFASPVEAVRCAVEIQEGVHTRNETLPEAQRLQFRIGVNLGDVMIDGADILGDGVNVAARLEGIADPGGICISSSVYDQIAGKLSLGFVDLGERSLKNIARPIRVYQFDRSGAFVGAKRSGAARNRTGAIVAGIVVVALAAFGAWRAGWLGGNVEPPSAPPPPVPVAAVAPPASEEMKMKLQIAEAERAKAEAELARTRADNDAAKQRTDAELAKLRSAPRVAAEKKDAPVPVNAAPAAPTGAGVSSSGSSGTALGPAPATPAQTAAAPAPAPVASAAAPAVVASAAPASAYVPVMSGGGTATRECDGFEEMRAFTDNRFSVRVDAGNISVERGTQGQVGYMFVQGRPSSDGRLTLVGTAIAANKRNLGKEINVYFAGAYADGAFALAGRTGSRPCRLTIRLDRRP